MLGEFPSDWTFSFNTTANQWNDWKLEELVLKTAKASHIFALFL